MDSLNSKNEVKSTDPLHLLKILVRFDKVGKPPYSFGMMLALEQARRLNLKSMTVAEFGVFRGEGLRELANAAVLFADASGIRINVRGFDTGTGMPQPVDYRDHPELWQEGGAYFTSRQDIMEMMPQHPLVDCDVIIGDVRDTVPSHLMPLLSAEAPLGFVSVDVDTYQSTKSALACFKGPATHYLPSVPVHMDDIEYALTTCSRTGEELAVAEFNEEQQMRFLERKKVRTVYPSKWWHHVFFVCQILDHPARAADSKAELGINVIDF